MNPDQQQSQDNTANLPEAPATDAQPVTTVEQSAAQAPIAEPVTEAPVQPEAPAPEAPVEPAVETTPPVESAPVVEQASPEVQAAEPVVDNQFVSSTPAPEQAPVTAPMQAQSPTPMMPEVPKKKNSMLVILIVGLVVVAAGAAVMYFLYM